MNAPYKLCPQCSEHFIVGGILWLPGEEEPRGEVCLTCALAKTAEYHKAKGKKDKIKVLHLKADKTEKTDKTKTNERELN